MNIIRFDYSSSGFDFLNLFEELTIKPGTLVYIVSDPLQKLRIRNEVSIAGLLACDYNFAYMRDYKTGSPWIFDTSASIPVIDTKLFVINNVESAAAIFALAKSCRTNFSFYQKLFGVEVEPYDNITLSFASHILNSPHGFFDIPAESLVHQPTPMDDAADFGYDHATNALINFSGVNTID